MLLCANLGLTETVAWVQGEATGRQLDAAEQSDSLSLYSTTSPLTR